MKKTTFEMGLDTKALYDTLKAAANEQTVTFTKMSEVLGRKVIGGNSNLQSALHRLEADGIAFANVRNVGYQRMNDVAVVGTAETSREGLRRKAKRAVKRLTCVSEFDKLPNDMKVKHNAALSGFGAIAAMMSPKNIKGLEATVALAGCSLPLAKTLEAFKV